MIEDVDVISDEQGFLMVIYTHGNKPKMDRSVLTISVQLAAAFHFSFAHLPAELPMLSVAATCLGYTANNPLKTTTTKEKRSKENRWEEGKTSPKFI